MMRSASRTAETSGVVTTTALSAPAMAFLKPCSMPAGQSIRIKSKPSSRRLSQSFCICSGETASLSRVCAAGSRNSPSKRLSLMSPCFRRQLPSTTSTRSYTIRFSSPITTSRFLRPISASTRATFLPNTASPQPRFAVVVVLPTPPLPLVITITSLIHVPPNLRVDFATFFKPRTGVFLIFGKISYIFLY